ncbi:hypothetical protein [Hymenobacter metallilatus]|uniref:ATP-binding protein n=1 Tax=Hymenobacter metallilatus TaxID=2493666 RepID=A0A3R9U6Y2_9BACT|nr:hypothetical protein [Hymenobacter metallilatus]RSK24180.1 hypothetical protein EI290_20585 [Hymenobacter metallilatus]
MPATRAGLGSLDALFTPIGVKDTRRPAGEALALPGDLGRFVGVIERHEYALVLRGDKGAGKTRLLYQLKNLFASVGLSVASFSLEIDKNSTVVAKNTAAYIAPANRVRIKIASEVPQGLATIRQAAEHFDVVAIDSWSKIPGTSPTDFDALRKAYPRTVFLVIFQSTTAGTARGGSSSEYDASAVCQVDLPGIAHFEKNRYATGPADELRYDVNEQRLTT